jgi:hypothetical protein
MYELHVGAGFRRLGWPLEWLPDAGERRPEMIVAPKTAQAVSVECKKRDRSDGFEQDASQFWHSLQFKLRKTMQAATLNFAVRITAEQFRLGDVDGVVSDTVDTLKSREVGAMTTSTGYRVEFTKLAESGESIPSDVFNLFPRGVYGVNLGQVYPQQVRVPRFPGDPVSEGMVVDPVVLRLELVDDRQRRVKGVLRILKSGAKQLLVGMPGVIYIDVSLGTLDRESVEFDSIAEAVRSRLEHTHTRVSAVVLTAIEPTRTMNGVPVWWIRTEVIEQPRPQHPLPGDIRLPGSVAGGQWIPGEWFLVG